jgi:hypothetical protein
MERGGFSQREIGRLLRHLGGGNAGGVSYIIDVFCGEQLPEKTLSATIGVLISS